MVSKVLFMILLQVISLGYLALACDGDHTGVMHKREAPSAPLTPPSRPLVWGDINVLHTTDTHGWLLGHQKESFPEPNYSGDLGDLSSFLSHMKTIAKRKKVDLLLVDSGDLHDGTGLADGYPPGGVDGHESTQFLTQLPYDVMAIGNHELYNYNVTLDMQLNVVPKLQGRYLSSNVNITYTDPNSGKVLDVPVGDRFAKFKTEMGRRVTSLGVLFDFTGNDDNTTVQPVEDMVKETWFAEAISEEPDLFLLVGHMPVRDEGWKTVHAAIRAVHPDTPILIFGGHYHIRDCAQFDDRTMAIASGRYMETLGWMSMKFPQQHGPHHHHGSSIPRFSRRYLDTNIVTYKFHSGRTFHKFTTDLGRKLTQGLWDLWYQFNLDFTFGTAPQDYNLVTAQYPGPNSQYSLFIEEVSPTVLAINNSRAHIPNLIVANSGSQRFDIYAGPFTKNDQLAASPFVDAYLYLPDVPYSAAKEVVPHMNSAEANNRRRSLELAHKAYGLGHIDVEYRNWVRQMDLRSNGIEKRALGNLTLGYVTEDSCPGVGDDTIHAALPSYEIPDFIASREPEGITDSDTVDLVFLDFFEKQLLEVLNDLDSDKVYTHEDVGKYSDVYTNNVYGVYAQQAWN